MPPALKSIRIAAAVIVDADGLLLVVRKRGTAAFMQPGGKIEPGEQPLKALARELAEELGLAIHEKDADYLGSFRAAAANEPDAVVEAELYRLRISGVPAPAAEIEAMAWIDPQDSGGMMLAPLTRDIVLCLVSQGDQWRHKPCSRS